MMGCERSIKVAKLIVIGVGRINDSSKTHCDGDGNEER